jgi:hypothetical protein
VAFTIEIDGTPVDEVQKHSLNIRETANYRATGAFMIRSFNAAYRPALDDEVIIEENSVRIFGGLVSIPRESAAAGVDGRKQVGKPHIDIDVTCVDFNAYTDRRIVSRAFPEGTLEDFLNIIITDYLTVYGVTLHASQVTGPTLPPLGFTVKVLTDVMNEVMGLTADSGEPFVWRIDENKVLRAFQPSTQAAPFDLEDPLPIREIVGDLTVETIRDKTYANRVIVWVPPITQHSRVEEFTGDGSTDQFFLTYTPFPTFALGFPLGTVLSDSVTETLSLVGGGGNWEYDPSDNSITRTLGAPGNGDAIEIEISGTFTANVDAEDAGEIAAVGLYERVFVLEDIPSGTTAQALADSYLARFVSVMKTISYETKETGLRPGQQQTVDIATRDIDTVAVITEVVTRDAGEATLRREVTAVIDPSKTNIGRKWQDTYLKWDKGQIPSVSGSTSIGAGGGGGAGGSDGYSYVVLTVDRTINNTIVVADVSGLSFPVEANSLYEFYLTMMHASESVTSDIRLSWSYPAGATMRWGPMGESAFEGWDGGNALTTPGFLKNETQDDGVGTVDNTGQNPSGRIEKGVVRVGGTAGTVQLRWRQGSAEATDNTIKADSYIKYRRIGS